MDLFTEITAVYPELVEENFRPSTGVISLRDDGDGIQYIYAWNYTKPLPAGMKIGK